MNDHFKPGDGAERKPMFYYPASTVVGEVIELSERETRHAVGARRLRIKEQVNLFNGKGLVASGEIAELGVQRRHIGVYIQSMETFSQPHPLVQLACALPKGDRLTGLLDMATQLGMCRFIPLLCRYSNLRVNNPPPPRWQRVCIEACKQSQRIFVPELSVPQNVDDTLAINSDSHWLWCADPKGESVWKVLKNLASNCAWPDTITLMIGPEGGFSAGELEQIKQHGVQLLNLGDAILRIETAAVAMLQSVNTLLTKSDST